MFGTIQTVAVVKVDRCVLHKNLKCSIGRDRWGMPTGESENAFSSLKRHSKDEPTARPYETNLPAIRPHHSTFGPGGCHFPAISDNHRCREDPHQQSICTQNLRSKHGKFTSTCGRCSFSTFTCTDHTRRGTRPSVNPSKSDLVDAKQLQCAASTTNTPSLPQSDYIRGRAIPSPGVEGKEKLPVKSTCSGGGMSFAVFIPAPACQRCLDPLHRGGFIAGMARRSRTFKKARKKG
jgi:hypothetical protein